jgi:hypothetical protein
MRAVLQENRGLGQGDMNRYFPVVLALIPLMAMVGACVSCP